MKTSRGGGAIATLQYYDCSDSIMQNLYMRMQFKNRQSILQRMTKKNIISMMLKAKGCKNKHLIYDRFHNG